MFSGPILLGAMLVLTASSEAQPESKSAPELPSPLSKEVEALDRLKAEREKLLKQLDPNAPLPGTAPGAPDDDPLSAERARLRQEIVDMLKRLETQKSTPAVASPPPKIRPGTTPDELGKALDPLSQANALYLAGSTDVALKAYKLIDTGNLNREDRTFVHYMIASCQRKLGNLTEAVQLYREVSDSGEQDFIKECAVWQLSNIRWRQELEGQLEDLRKRLKK